MTGLDITEESAAALAEYGRVPIAFTVDEALEVEPVDGGLGGLRFVARPLAAPYVKDSAADLGHRDSDA